MEKEKEEPGIRLEVSEDTAKGIEALKRLEDATRGFLGWVAYAWGDQEWKLCRDAYEKLKSGYLKYLVLSIQDNLELSEYQRL